jgi:hypothetical protein
MSSKKVATVSLPDFFIALVLPAKERKPTPDECEEIMRKTNEFWSEQLKDDSFPKKFNGLNLKLESTHFGSDIGNRQYIEDDVEGDENENELTKYFNLDPKFNVYLQVTGTVQFVSKGSGIPSGNEVFGEMTKGDSLAYLVRYVRKLSKNSVFASAVEVLARRLILDPSSQGGTVRAPTFFIAFATQPFDDEPPKDPPTDKDVEELRRITHEQIDDHLKKAYPNNYVSSELTVIKHECGTSKPDDRFEIYVENDFWAKFSSDPPSEAELFNVIMKCGSTDSTRYLQSCMEIKESQFEDVSMVTIQVVGLEMPQVEDLPPPPEAPTGDPAESTQEENDLAGPIIVSVPIFLALVVHAEPPASLPDQEELMEFKDLLIRYFYTVLQNEYPDSITNIKLVEEYTQFDGGIPEARFNMCTEYDAQIHFKPGTDPVPDEKELNMLILECNLSTILAYVRKLTPLCFQQTTEITMRRTSQKPNADDPINDGVFEAAVDLPPAPALLDPPLPKEEKKAEPAPKKQPQDPVQKPESKKKLQPAPKKQPQDPVQKPESKKKLQPAPKKQPQDPVQKPESKKKLQPAPKKPDAKVKAEEPKGDTTPPKKPKKVPPTKKPSKPTPPPVDDDEDGGYASPHEKDEKMDKVKCSDVYVALKLDRVEYPPSKSEMDDLRKNTQDFFSLRLKELYPTTFHDMDLQIGVMEWGMGKPKEIYNLYVEWVIVARFRDLSCPTSPIKTVIGNKNRKLVPANEKGGGRKENDDIGFPDTATLTRSLVKGAPIIDYLVGHVRIMEGSSFENATAVFIQQRIDL